MANGLFSSLFGTGRQQPGLPMDKETANITPEASYIADMQKLLRGDVSSALTGGEKLMALGALMRSAARGSQVSPQEVMQNVRQTAQTRTATQMQLAQLQAKAMREQSQRQFLSNWGTSSAIPEAKRELIKNMDTADAMKVVQEEVFRPKQVQQIVRTADGKTRIVYQDGTDQETEWQLPAKTKYQDLGGKLVLVNEDTGEVVRDAQGNPRELPKTMSPGEAARLNIAQQQLELQRSRGGGDGGGGQGRGQLVQTDQGFAVFDPRARTLQPMTTPLRPKPTGGNQFIDLLTGGGGARRFGQ